jgi:hypothetical protein
MLHAYAGRFVTVVFRKKFLALHRALASMFLAEASSDHVCVHQEIHKTRGRRLKCRQKLYIYTVLLAICYRDFLVQVKVITDLQCVY